MLRARAADIKMTDVDNYEYESLEEYTIDYDRDWDALKPVQKSDYPKSFSFQERYKLSSP